MLVLSRKLGERIVIGDLAENASAIIQANGPIVITVVRIGPNNVRLGIEAPKNLNIVREELLPEFAGSAA